MTKQLIQIVSLFLTALVAGSVFGIWRGYNPASFSATTFIEQHQNAVRGLNTLMPVLGALTILSTLTWAYLQRAEKGNWYLLVVALVLLLASALVTRFGNQPINAQVMTWSPTAPPVGWQDLRDAWWRFHLIRTGSTILALLLLIIASVQSSGTR